MQNNKIKNILLLIMVHTLCAPVLISPNFTRQEMSLNQLKEYGSGSGTLIDKKNSSESGSIKSDLNNSTVRFLSVGFRSVVNNVNDGSTSEKIAAASVEEVRIDGIPLVHPNPFSQREGGEIGYQLNTQAEIEIQIYDMRGKRIFKNLIPKGAEGGAQKYNIIKIDQESLDGYELQSGVYFFVLRHEGKVIGRGKMAVVP